MLGNIRSNQVTSSGHIVLSLCSYLMSESLFCSGQFCTCVATVDSMSRHHRSANLLFDSYLLSEARSFDET